MLLNGLIKNMHRIDTFYEQHFLEKTLECGTPFVKVFPKVKQNSEQNF